jgi:hypothetical protein
MIAPINVEFRTPFAFLVMYINAIHKDNIVRTAAVFASLNLRIAIFATAITSSRRISEFCGLIIKSMAVSNIANHKNKFK